MEQLQRQQGAKLEMNLQEKQLLQAQLLFAHHAAAARASGTRLDTALFGKADGQIYQAAQQAMNSHPTGIDAEEDDEESDEEEQEMMEPEENDDMDEDEDDDNCGPYQQQEKKPGLQHVPGFLFPSFSAAQSAAVKQQSPPSAIKQEPEEKELLSPAGQRSFTSPNGFADWSYDEPFKQVGSSLI